MQRRDFLAETAALGAAAVTGAAVAQTATRPAGGEGAEFRLDYAPHFDMFRHHAGDDPVAQLEFMHAEGFRSIEDNGMARRSVEDQERIARAMERLGMRMGVFVAHAEFGEITFARGTNDMAERLRREMHAAVEVAKRVNATWCTVVPGRFDQRVAPEFQTAHVVENLKLCAGICEKAGLVMVLEPLNPRDHPGLFLTRIPQGSMICRAVGSPSCRILDDLYHQQVTEGNLIPNMDDAWHEIAYFQVGDNPGRREPTTGEINYRNVFRHIHDKGFRGIVGMEHGKKGGGRDGERAVIDAYRSCDAWGD